MRQRILAAVLLTMCSILPLAGQSQTPQKLGSVTHQPLPRWVSMKAPEANARRGPSMNHRIDWVFRHRNMPLLVTAEYEHWRRVQDRDGFGGWVHYVLLSRARTVIVDDDMVDLRRQPLSNSDVVAQAEAGVIAQLKECENGWCRIIAGPHKGWVPEESLWGVDLPD